MFLPHLGVWVVSVFTGFSFFQLLHSSFLVSLAPSDVLVSFSCYLKCFGQLLPRVPVLVSFSCYWGSTCPPSFWPFSFSFFQLLRRMKTKREDTPCVLVSFSCYTSASTTITITFRVLVSFSCYLELARVKPGGGTVLVSFSCYQSGFMSLTFHKKF